jgi:hypothetical protein
MKRVLVSTAIGAAMASCSSFAYYNRPVEPSPPPVTRATFNIREDRGEKDVLVLLALSGGGSRAAYFSGAVMLRMQQVFSDLDLLQEVDVISSVSGGSLPAAYYAVSRDPAIRLRDQPPPAVREHPKLRYDPATRELALSGGPLTPTEIDAARPAFTDPQDRRQFERLVAQQAVASNRVWDAPTVKDLMARNYVARWLTNWFWPDNIFLYWFTAYDRSDIMAQTFADNLYDIRYTGRDLKFRDINPERPYLILNATNGTERADQTDSEFGSIFTFTDEDFRQRANSDVGSYFVARAVMASAAFPVVFNYTTLRNYFFSKPNRYLHLFDGGNAARIDGCNRLQALLRVVLPLSGPALVAAAVFSFITCWNEFLFAFMLTQTEAAKTVTVVLSNFTTDVTVDFALMNAAGVIAVVPPVLLALLFRRFVVSGLVTGAVKG